MNLDDVLDYIRENTYTFPVKLLSDQKKTVEIRSINTNDQKIIAVEGNEVSGEFGNFTLVLKLLDTCIIKNDYKISDMLVEDFFWVVIKLLMKSLGEQIDIMAGCKDCKPTEYKKKNAVIIDLEKDIEITYLEKIKNNVIDISPKLKLILKHITVNDMAEILARVPEGDKEARMLFSLAALIKEIEFDEELIELEDFDQKEKILGEMTRDQLDKIKQFLDDNKFGIKVKKEYKCKNCECVNNINFDGFEIIDFF